MIIITETGSQYEINEQALSIRRITGKNKPTPRQCNDGEWKKYSYISEPLVGARLFIIWDYINGVAKSTMTSPIVEIISCGITASNII